MRRWICAGLGSVATWALACGLLGGVAAAQDVTLSGLLEEMVDRDELARVPEPAFTCRQASSFDRDTVGLGKPGWWANWDRSQFVRTETNAGRTERVLMDVEGPGAVVRFWGTWHGPRGGPFSNGTLRVYIDGAETPAIEGPTSDLISGGRLVGAPLSSSVSPETDYRQRGHNLYLPIPYASHCKITYETAVEMDRGAKRGEALYYQINYRTYAEGTSVESFSMERLEANRPLLARVQQRLMVSGASGRGGPGGRGGRSGRGARRGPISLDGPIAPGASRSVEIEGPAAIRELTVNLSADDRAQALRSTVVEIVFDDQRTVWCPVGDLFGTGYRPRVYQTWYTRYTLDGSMSCFWTMPFQRSCRITLHNLGSQDVTVALGRARVGRWAWDDRSLLFHASWRQYSKIDTGPNKDMTGKGAFDVNYVKVKGAGRYVGDTLVLYNCADAWWGEGDEKIFVDGEVFPSHVGTGTEDYYGYAWCKPAYFCMPFHAQPDGSGNLSHGFSVNSRYRGLDSIPFRSGIQFDMELWHWRHTKMNYAPSSFWYARPGGSSNVEPDPDSAKLPVALELDDVIEVFRAKGAIEGESLKIARRDGGTTEVQRDGGFGWSGNQQLWWKEGKPGSRLALEVPVSAAGKYRVRACLTKAVDYGIVRFSIDGREIGDELDRYHTAVETDVLDLGVHQLPAGKVTLEVRIVGRNPSAVPKHMFGLDYLLLDAVR